MSSIAVLHPDSSGSRDVDFGGGARSIFVGDRYLELERRMSYYDCTQHDKKFWDFDGRPINPNTRRPMIGIEQQWWVPLANRRPSTPVRLGRVIVESFTNLLFGENRFPSIRVDGDEQTEDWLQTAARVGKLSAKMIQARSYGGASGTCGVSWCFREGKPQFEAHKPQNLFVHSWMNRSALVPEHVSDVSLFYKVKWDGRGFNKIWYWYRRDWTPDADVVFREIPYEKDKEPTWIVDEEKTIEHGDGICHLEWIQNLPTDELDGKPDYDGLYENFDSIDLVMSVITRGAIRNLDPTVKLKMDRDEIQRMGIAKGSDNALVVGKDGDADYMELGGQSIDAGIRLVDAKRKTILETAQCIVPDPNEVAAQGVSSVAIMAMFAPMRAKTDTLREQYGTGVERILDNMSKSARAKTSAPVLIQVAAPASAHDLLGPAPAAHGDLLGPPPGATAPGHDLLGGAPSTPDGSTPPIAPEEEEAIFVVDLPPKYEEKPILDVLTNQPTGDVQTVATPRQLGPGGEVNLQWPPYFAPTPQDQAQITQSLSTATGAKQFLSQETATEVAARAFGTDPAEEWRRVQAEGQAAQASQASMLDVGAAGGAVEHESDPPPGADPKPPPAPHEQPLLPDADPDDHVPVDLDLTGR